MPKEIQKSRELQELTENYNKRKYTTNIIVQITQTNKRSERVIDQILRKSDWEDLR